MFLSPKLKSPLLLLLASVALVACSGKGDGNDVEALGADGGLLQYVPDDTPYLFAALEPLPDDVMDKLEPQIDLTLKTYQQVIRAAVEGRLGSKNVGMDDDGDDAGDGIGDDEGDDDAAGNGVADAEEPAANNEVDAATKAVVEELAGLFSLEGMRNAGIGRESTMVVYGAGLLPVMRAHLTDIAAFETTLDRLETRAGKPMERATVDGLDYRYAGDDKAHVVIAVKDDDLVVALTPANLSDAGLRTVFGLTPPATSIAASGKLKTLAEEYEYKNYGLGFVDLERIVAAFLDAPAGINKELLAQTPASQLHLSDVCKAEFREISGIAPRMVTGYTEVSTQQINSNTIFELRQDIADGLKTMNAPVPGLGEDQGGLFSFGVGLNILAAREFYAARLDALEKDPYECELLADAQAGLAESRAMLNQPVPPIVYGVKGFLAVVDKIEGMDIARQQPPTDVSMRFLLATENAPGLLAMGTMFSPELAALNLQPDGKPVRFESPQLQPPVDTVYVAMTKDALALSAGVGTESGLEDMLKAKPGDPLPFVGINIDSERYYSFIGDAIMMQNADNENLTPEINRAVGSLMQNIGKLIQRISLNVNFTSRGIEMPSEVTLAE